MMNRIFYAFLVAMMLVLGGCSEPSEDSGAEAGHDEPVEAGQSHEGDDHEREERVDEDAGARQVELTQSQLERLDIRLGEVRPGTAGDLVSAPATVAFDRDRIARVGPRLDAKVVEVIADLGDRVPAGDPLAVLDSVALGKAKARHLTTKARVDTVRANFERQRRLNEKQIVSEAELLEARARLAETRAEHDAADEELRLYGMSPEQIDAVRPDTEQPLSRYVLLSPIDGTIEHRDVVPGQTVRAGETPFLVVNTKAMWLMIQVAERDLAGLRAGQAVELRLRSMPDRRFTGVLDWISTQLDEQTRSARVRAVLENPDGALRAGMFGTATIRVESQTQVGLVPTDAIQRLGPDDMVFVPGEGSGKFRAVAVKTGAENAGDVEIIEGLEPGSAVVIGGAFDLMSALTAATRSAAHSH